MEDKNLLNVAGLSFFDIKYNFINYLKSQPEFTDYNLEGSNISVLLDILSYNTQQHGMYNTLVANEMFIDKAAKRSSVVSLSKLLGYSPATQKAATAKVLVVVDAEDLPLSGILNRGTTFTGVKDQDNYTFTNIDSYAFYPYETKTTSDPEDASAGEIISYACGPIVLKQGILNTLSYNVSDYSESFVITEQNADRDSVKVFVMKSVTDSTGIDEEWIFAKNIVDIDQDSKVFFMDENEIGQLYITFGDGVLGKSLEIGNVVVIEYLTTSGLDGNNIGLNDSSINRSFSGDIGTVLTLEPSSGGRGRESIRTMKKNAVRNYTSKERAVTSKDYEGIVLGNYNDNVAVRCWGGEDNDPPQYGKVFISIRPIGSTILSKQEKKNLVDNILSTKNILGTTVEIVDPEVLYVNCNVTVYFDRATSTMSMTTITKQIKSTLNYYFTLNLVEFGDSIFANDIEDTIKKINSGIKSVDVTLTIERRHTPNLGVAENLTIDFQNKLYHPQSSGYKSILTTNSFKIYENNQYITHYLKDDGSGKINLFKIQNNQEFIVKSNYGTIDYDTGKINIPAFKVDKFEIGKNFVEFKVVPDQPNIFGKRNTILAFEQNDNDSLEINIKEVKTQKVIGGSGFVVTQD